MPTDTTKIAKDKVVSIDYTLTNDAGQVLDSSQGREPLTYLHGHGGLIPGMEKGLEGKSTGDSFKITLPPEDGYGHKDPNMVQPVPRSNFQGIPNIEKGMQFQARSPDGRGARVVTVVDVSRTR
jgi:FKBP-type peptidyl-prolyl cis-trans isomerase SlyD